jgi:hypothetical protein
VDCAASVLLHKNTKTKPHAPFVSALRNKQKFITQTLNLRQITQLSEGLRSGMFRGAAGSSDGKSPPC